MLPPEWTVKKSLSTAGGFVYHKQLYTRLPRLLCFFAFYRQILKVCETFFFVPICDRINLQVLVR